MFNCTSPAFYFLTFERVDCTIFTQLVGCLSSTSPLIFVLQMPNIFLLFLRRFYCPPHTSLLQMFSVFFPCSTKELFFFFFLSSTKRAIFLLIFKDFDLVVLLNTTFCLTSGTSVCQQDRWH